jgi:hypothetical protein
MDEASVDSFLVLVSWFAEASGETFCAFPTTNDDTCTSPVGSRRPPVMEKVDFKKLFKDLYSPPAKNSVVVTVPKMSFLMIDGKGDPNTSADYRAAIETLYTLSYTLKFMLKQAGAVDYAVAPLEGLWWTDEKGGLGLQNKTQFQWTAMMMQPKQVTKAWLDKAVAAAKKKRDLPTLAKVRFESYDEGRSVQIMHIGPYSAEGPTIARLHEFAKEKGYSLRGKHHEIYLGDPRRTAPERLRTVIRQPVQ